ncbi:MAG: EcsC family protein [Pygmaiobacter massiliensis]|nr:EcsC family protein [Pygmaiobacter massiliensis]
MANDLEKEWLALKKQERRFLQSAIWQMPGKSVLLEKVPSKLQTTLQTAFEKAFRTLFLQGGGFIEKTFDKEELAMDFEAGDYLVQKRQSHRTFHRLDKTARKGQLANQAVTTAVGLGMGLLGMGLPDIPLLTATLLKGVYQIALGYGFDYHTPAERCAVLRIFTAAFALQEEASETLALAQSEPPKEPDLDREIALASAALADALLVEKFVQGIPLVGAAGALVNHSAYRRVSKAASLCYKKRYLRLKGAGRLGLEKDLEV